MIIHNNRIVSATCYLPLSDSVEIGKEMGTRHRAAVGISEVSDSITVIVSEETGDISIARDGKIIRHLDPQRLRDELAVLRERKRTEIRNSNYGRGGIEMKKRMESDLLLKIISVVFAFLLWMFVINTDNPVIKKTFSDVPVDMLNEQVLDDLNQTYKIESGDTVSFTVKGKKRCCRSFDKVRFPCNGRCIFYVRCSCNPDRS